MRYPVSCFLCLVVSFSALSVGADPLMFLSRDVYHAADAKSASKTSFPGNGAGIKEIVPKEYLSRYQKWKGELLATPFGRGLWDKYDKNPDFLLTIRISSSRKNGAGTDDFEWDANGRLIAATVTLGKDLDKGFPDPVYYPVMNSLSTRGDFHSITGDLLASTKLAHEIGHVTYTAEANSQVFRRQNRLMESYYNIFLKNGFDTRDPRLVSLENELGARPLAIWEDREYWSEVSALRFLVQRIEKTPLYCSVISRVKNNLAIYASGYESRFDLSNISNGADCGS
jgi:hypothetical protein